MFTAFTVDISGFDKAELLMALYNRAKPTDKSKRRPMSLRWAKILIKRKADSLVFHTLNGRVLEVNISSSLCCVDGYNRANGKNAFEFAIKNLTRTFGVSKQEARKLLHEEENRILEFFQHLHKDF